MSVLGLDSRYMVKYNPSPSGTPSGKGLYLTIYALSRPNTDTVQFEYKYLFQALNIFNIQIFVLIPVH